MNWTETEVSYTWVIEYKHFDFGSQPNTMISWEYSSEWKHCDESYYPVNVGENDALFFHYKNVSPV